MNQNEHPVYPNINRTVKICKFKYQVIELILFESIRLAVYLYDDKDMLIEAKQYLFKNDEYNGWENDDKYIINLLKKKIQE